jgi:very-short-patch-repair endonuclease
MTIYKRSSLESKFEKLWEQNCSDIALEVEVLLVPGRKFRSDFYHRASGVVIEVHGGQFMKSGGHNSAAGLKRDAEKQNALTILGYKCLVLHTTQVTKDNIIMIRDFIDDITKP